MNKVWKRNLRACKQRAGCCESPSARARKEGVCRKGFCPRVFCHTGVCCGGFCWPFTWHGRSVCKAYVACRQQCSLSQLMHCHVWTNKAMNTLNAARALHNFNGLHHRITTCNHANGKHKKCTQKNLTPRSTYCIPKRQFVTLNARIIDYDKALFLAAAVWF